jgi:uncharacterized membrane-anchored protein
MKNFKPALIGAGLALVLAVAGWNVWSNERILSRGRVVRLALAPVDPRSLMQGDYMALQYAIARDLQLTRSKDRGIDDDDGYVIVRLDEHRVAQRVRIQADTQPRAADEIAIRYRVRDYSLRIATNAFFFQEGQGSKLEGARYGEFRVGDNGEPRLTALLDANFSRLGENRY